MIDTDVRTLFSEALSEDPPVAPLSPAEDVARGKRLRRRRRSLLAAGGAGVLAVASLFVAMLPGFPDQSGAIAGDPADQVTTSVENPSLLIDHPDWTMARGWSDDSGGAIVYERGADRASIYWNSYEPDMSQLTINRDVGYPETATTVLGHDAVLFELSRGELPEVGGYSAIWQDGGVDVEVVTFTSAIEEFDRDDFTEVIGSLHEVDRAAWRDAVDEVVDFYDRSHDNSDVVAEIAADLPVPDTWASDIGRDRLSSIDPDDKTAMIVGVAHWAACYWVREWVYGQFDGEAVDVADELTAVVTWATTHDVITEESVWDYTDAIIAGEDTINGNSMARHAPDYLRCGGW